MKASFLMLGAAMVMAIQGGLAPPIAWAKDRPAQADCASVANLDLDDERFHPDWTTAANAERLERWHGYLGRVQIPEAAAHRPSETATMIVRAYVPAGGMWPVEGRSVVWRDADGTWWFWRQRINYSAPSPSPPPPPPGQPAQPYVPPTLEERFPPSTGRLAAGQAEAMEAAYSDACRGWDPEFFPSEQPFLRPVEGRASELCPPDSSVFFAEITEVDRPRLLYVAACQNNTPTFALMRGATYAAADAPEG